MKIRTAKQEDVASIVAMVNIAYRGETEVKGWTNEIHLFEGEIVDAEFVAAKISQPDTAILLAEKNEKILGSVMMRVADKGCYLGLLAVSPAEQASGVGRFLIESGENWAREHKQNKVYMQVINSRHELIAWYERRGYRRNGETLNFESHVLDKIRPGVSLEQLNFVFLEKTI